MRSNLWSEPEYANSKSDSKSFSIVTTFYKQLSFMFYEKMVTNCQKCITLFSNIISIFLMSHVKSVNSYRLLVYLHKIINTDVKLFAQVILICIRMTY